MRNDETVSYSLTNQFIPAEDRVSIHEYDPDNFDFKLNMLDHEEGSFRGYLEFKIQWYAEWIAEIPATLEDPAQPGHWEWSDLCILSAKLKAFAYAPDNEVLVDEGQFTMKGELKPEDNADLWRIVRGHLEFFIGEKVKDSYYEEKCE